VRSALVRAHNSPAAQCGHWWSGTNIKDGGNANRSRLADQRACITCGSRCCGSHRCRSPQIKFTRPPSAGVYNWTNKRRCPISIRVVQQEAAMDLRLELVSVPVADVDRANGVGSLSAEEQFAAPAALVQGRWVVGGPDSWVVGYAANSGITHPAIRVERGEPFGLDHVRALMAPRPRRSKCHPRRIADAARQGLLLHTDSHYVDPLTSRKRLPAPTGLAEHALRQWDLRVTHLRPVVAPAAFKRSAMHQAGLERARTSAS